MLVLGRRKGHACENRKGCSASGSGGRSQLCVDAKVLLLNDRVVARERLLRPHNKIWEPMIREEIALAVVRLALHDNQRPGGVTVSERLPTQRVRRRIDREPVIRSDWIGDHPIAPKL